MPNAECYQTSLATEQISADWDQYVLGHAEGTLFHLSQWKRVVEKSFGHKAHYLAAYEQAAGTLVGILPLFEIKSALFGHFLVSVPFAELGGGLADSPAVESLLSKTGLRAEDFDVVESNEAFAAQACAVTAKLGLDPARVNPSGGAIALGHPVGATGAILTVKCLYELQRTGGRHGLVTMCIGGGQGIALALERV